MKVIPHPTLPSQMLLGYRVDSETDDLLSQTQAQLVLVAIVKGTFMADDPTPTPLPTEQQIPIFLQDGFFNVVQNADFTEGEQKDSEGNLITSVSSWITSGPEISHLKDSGTTMMRSVGSGEITQALTFDAPLGNRSFILQFRAKASANIALNGIRIRSKSGEIHFAETYLLTSSFQIFTSSIYTWSPELEDTEATLILQGISGITIDYDYVQLVEGSTIFPFDPDNPIRYEHDLAIYKPLTDIVVLGKPEPLSSPPPGGVGPIGSWTERVRLGSDIMEDSFTNPVTKPFTFGWQNRVKGDRGERNPIDAATGYAGFFGPDGTAFDPSTMKLPERFNNLFFNGGLYRSANSPPRPVFDYPPAGATITLESEAVYQVGSNFTPQTVTRTLQLPDSPQAILTYLSSSAPDAAMEQVTLPLAVDTIVFDKDSNQFYAIWRGTQLIQQGEEPAELPLERLISLEFS